MRRRGFVLVEVIVACGLAAVLLAVCLQVLTVMATERRYVERRAIAQQEAANLIERVSSIPFEQLTPARLQSLTIDPDAARLLPESKAALSLAEEPGELAAKRVNVEISWLGAAKRRELPVRLTTWVFDPASRNATKELRPRDETAPAVAPPAVAPPAGPSLPSPAGPAVLPPLGDEEPPVTVERGTP